MKSFISQYSRKLFHVLPRYSDYSAILMLHRVGLRESNRIPANQNMVITPDELDAFVSKSKKSGWSFISMDELVETVKNNLPIKKTLILTFDDGYLDNLTDAAPVLEANEVPYIVYVTTGFIEGDEMPWWYSLESMLSHFRELQLPDGSSVIVDSLADRQSAFMAIRQEIMSSNYIAKQYKDWMRSHSTFPCVEEKRVFMNWAEVKELASLSFATIGAHTHTHPVLSRLSDVDAFEEVSQSKEILQANLGKVVKHFAFPFGGNAEVSKKDLKIVAELGFESAVTTRMGAISKSECDLLSLPRCFYGPSLSLKALQNELFEFMIKNRFKKALGYA